MPIFQGGPLDPGGQGVGQITPEDEAMADQYMAAQGGGAPAEGGGDPASRLDRALAEIRSVLQDDGFDEQETLALEKVTTLIQDLKAKRQKTMDAAMQGKVSPAAFRQMGQAGAGGGY